MLLWKNNAEYCDALGAERIDEGRSFAGRKGIVPQVGSVNPELLHLATLTDSSVSSRLPNAAGQVTFAACCSIKYSRKR